MERSARGCFSTFGISDLRDERGAVRGRVRLRIIALFACECHPTQAWADEKPRMSRWCVLPGFVALTLASRGAPHPGPLPVGEGAGTLPSTT